MIRHLVGAAGAMLGTVLALGPAQARTLEQVAAGNATVSAYADDTTGAFTHCAGVTDYRSGVDLIFMLDGALDWSMAFSGKLGAIQPGETHVVRYRVDRGPVRSGPATAVTETMVQMRLDDTTGFFQELRRGRQLIADGGNERLTFALRDTQRLLSDVLTCAEKWSKQAPVRVAQASDAGGKPTAPLSEPERRLEATTVAVNVLSRAQVAGFELQPPDVPPRLAGHDVTWRAQNVTGSLRLAGLDGGTALEKIRAELIATDIQACPGRFTAESMPGTDGKETSLFTLCQGDKGWAANYLAMPRAKAGAYVLSLVAPPDKAEALKTMAEALRVAALQVVARTP